MLARSSERDVEGSYQVLISLLDRLSDAETDLPVMVKKIAADLRSSTTEKPSLR